MTLLLEPATLWPAVLRATRDALGSGALAPIETEREIVPDGDIRFVVRVVSSLRRKERARASRSQPDPFLPPYDPDLFVADISDRHVALLNKFPVMDHHVLVVTREPEAQETLLGEDDFEALWACLAEVDGLAFYNGGPAAGASEPHKHMQLVPTPLGEPTARTPVDDVVLAGELPFAHAAAPFEPDPTQAHGRYLELLARIDRRQPPAPYNFLATREWMLAVPRTREHARGISVNALGFAGSLLAKDEAGLATIRRTGPAAMLRNVSQ